MDVPPQDKDDDELPLPPTHIHKVGFDKVPEAINFFHCELYVCVCVLVCGFLQKLGIFPSHFSCAPKGTNEDDDDDPTLPVSNRQPTRHRTGFRLIRWNPLTWGLLRGVDTKRNRSIGKPHYHLRRGYSLFIFGVRRRTAGDTFPGGAGCCGICGENLEAADEKCGSRCLRLGRTVFGGGKRTRDAQLKI